MKLGEEAKPGSAGRDGERFPSLSAEIHKQHALKAKGKEK